MEWNGNIDEGFYRSFAFRNLYDCYCVSMIFRTTWLTFPAIDLAWFDLYGLSMNFEFIIVAMISKMFAKFLLISSVLTVCLSCRLIVPSELLNGCIFDPMIISVSHAGFSVNRDNCNKAVAKHVFAEQPLLYFGRARSVIYLKINKFIQFGLCSMIDPELLINLKTEENWKICENCCANKSIIDFSSFWVWRWFFLFAVHGCKSNQVMLCTDLDKWLFRRARMRTNFKVFYWFFFLLFFIRYFVSLHF